MINCRTAVFASVCSGIQAARFFERLEIIQTASEINSVLIARQIKACSFVNLVVTVGLCIAVNKIMIHRQLHSIE